MSLRQVCTLLIVLLVATVFPRKLDDQPEHLRRKQSKLMESYIKSSVNPCDDFYEFACGNWGMVNPIPKNHWKYSTFQQMYDKIDNELKELLSQPIVSGQLPSAVDKAKLYYRNCVDEKARDSRGTAPLLKFIKDLGGWPVLDRNWSKKNFDLTHLVIKSSVHGILINYDLVQNPSTPTEHLIYLRHPTFGLADKQVFLQKNQATRDSLGAYKDLIKKFLQLLNVDSRKAQRVSIKIVNFEVQLAKATLRPAGKHSGALVALDIQNMQETMPYVNWRNFFSGVEQTPINVNQSVSAMYDVLHGYYNEKLSELLDETDSRTLANYIVWRCVLSITDSLDSNFRSALDVLNAGLMGKNQPLPLWKTCLHQISSNMDMATSSMYIRGHFDEYSKNETIRIANSLKAAFDENLLELDWIDAKTKAYASKKAKAIKVEAGYPADILSEDVVNRRYKDVRISEGKHFENFISIRSPQNQGRLFRPFDKNNWPKPPTNVNAVSMPNVNRILVLAGILQAPVFHKYFPQSMNYGGIGVFLGHEIIHGFDDEGRQYDIEGRTRESWWSPESISEFDKRKTCFLDQYADFSKRDGSLKSSGTITENLADNGGIRLAFKAYLGWKQANSHSKETFSNLPLNENQLFFVSFAQLFCEVARPDAGPLAKTYDLHSPAKYRVLGTLSNFEKFSEAFSCPANCPMSPSKRCRLW